MATTSGDPSTKPEHIVLGHRTCPLCEATCGLEIGKRGDEWLIRGDRDDPFSKGFLCPKGSAIGALHDDPDRLAGPVIRRGDDPATATWEEVSWDEAFAEIERRLTEVVDTHGRQALGAYVGNPNAHNHESSFFLPPLLRALGSTNLFSASTVDQMPKHVSSGMLFGSPDIIPVPDLDRTDFLLMLGANPVESNGSLCTAPDFPGRLKAIVDRGGRFVCVDPNFTRTAALATDHLAIRPGTDAHFLLALTHEVVSSGAADLGTLAEHCDGFDELAGHLAPFTADAVAPVTGIDAGTIRSLAADLAAAPSAAVYARIGAHTTRFGTLASWATELLNLVTGNLDRPGGAMFPLAAHARRGSGSGRGFVTGRWASRVRGLPEVRAEFPAAALAEEITTPGDGQIRALFTVAGNPVLSCPDAGAIDDALAQLDLLVSVDPWLNETTRHAHVILPPPGPLARSHYDVAFTTLSVRNVAKWSPPTVEAHGPAEWEILARLTLLLGGEGPDGDPWAVAEATLAFQLERAARALDRPVEELRGELTTVGRSGADQVLDVLIRAGEYGDRFGAVPDGLSLDYLAANPHGVDLGPLGPRIPEILRTPDGRIPIVPEPIAADLGRLVADLERDRDGEYLLVGRRHVRSNNSWMHNVRVLVKGKPRCTLLVNPSDAATLGLRDGATATVSSAVGTVAVPVEIADTIRPGVVSLPHGWGHDRKGARLSIAAAHAGVNSNLLTDPEPVDPLSGNAELNAIPVTLSPAG